MKYVREKNPKINLVMLAIQLAPKRSRYRGYDMFSFYRLLELLEVYNEITEQSWFKKLSDRARKDPVVKDNYKRWVQHMLNVKGWRSEPTRSRVPKFYASQDKHAAIQAKSAALTRAKQLGENIIDTEVLKMPVKVRWRGI